MARRTLQPLQFGDLALEHDESGGMGSIEATHPEHGYIGHIYWNTDPHDSNYAPGAVTSLAVDKEFQGQGIATHLYRSAQAADPRVTHSSNLTGDGVKFA